MMSRLVQMRLFTDLDTVLSKPEDWTFNGASTRELTHCYHDYPARMIPQVAGKLLDLFGTGAGLLFDPYCGTGTSLVEGLIRGINAVGTDLNPLARLIAQAKTATPSLQLVDEQISRFQRFVSRFRPTQLAELPNIPGIAHLDFWFKPAVIEKLLYLRTFIENIEDALVKLFFQVAFSETVRESSNTRSGEFKLYRYSPKELERFNPDVFGIMASKMERNRTGLQKFLAIMQNFEHPPRAHIYDFNTVVGVPRDKVAPRSVDIVVTSPPYGDSRTTVAYGQYSRLSAAWLGLENADRIDRHLMGGKVAREVALFPSDALNQAISQIREVDERRALEVSSFYADLYASIQHISPLIKVGGHVCYVVGNRRVKGITLPTDVAIRDFFAHFGFSHVETFHRSIPNKRMPLRNSPSNVAGAVDKTMTREHIIVMRCQTA